MTPAHTDNTRIVASGGDRSAGNLLPSQRAMLDARTPRPPLDIRVVRSLGRLLRGVAYALIHFDDVYVLARAFLLTVAGGTVSPEIEACRRAFCDGKPGQACGGRRTIEGCQYCVVESCRCPRSRWWPFSQLRWKRKFRAWRCPLGKFPAERVWWRRP
ncbi:MAG TPA: hypothetical protein PKK06_05325 [Phycisphaerae bacterium]|nr:hypothetical protein [Phycisphaerae bacterium]HNU44822.1 hypothetical protein [Phycisphaerae bacterium]